jgi:hypothetical protein
VSEAQSRDPCVVYLGPGDAPRFDERAQGGPVLGTFTEEDEARRSIQASI